MHGPTSSTIEEAPIKDLDNTVHKVIRLVEHKSKQKERPGLKEVKT